MNRTGVDPRELALDVLTMAVVGGMPDTYWLTDSRVARACDVLEVPIQIGRQIAEELVAKAER